MESYRDIVEFLLARKLAPRSALIRDGFRIQDASRRNCNLRIEFSGGRGYFVKIATDPERKGTLLREAQTYRFLLSRMRGARSRSLIPRLRLFDRDASVLVIELLERDNLKRRCARRTGFVPGWMAKLGRGIGGLHRQLSTLGRPKQCGVLYPLPFHLLLPSKSFVETSSPANIELLRIVQGSEVLSHELTRLTERWKARVQSHPSLIHGDLRLENCCTAVKSKRLRIVDWELAGVGDPGWDAGAVLADLVSVWLMSAAIPTGWAPAKAIQFAGIRLDSLRSAGRAFWSAYAAARGLAGDAQSEALRSTIYFAAARLLQLAYEHQQGFSDLTVHAVSHAQLSENLMRRPIDGAAHILGIPA